MPIRKFAVRGDEKLCVTCGEWKKFSQFNKNASHSTGLQSECRECRKLRKKRAYRKDGSSTRALALAYRSTVVGAAREITYMASIRANKKNITFEIDLNFIKNKVEQYCEKTGIPFDLKKGKGWKPFAPSIDRIDSRIGYTRDNVQVVPVCYNMGKRDFPEIDFIAMCCAVAERHAHRPEVIQRLKELRNAEF